MPAWSFLQGTGAAASALFLGAFGYANLPTRLTCRAAAPSVKYLAEGQLTLIEPGKSYDTVKAGDLFARRSPMLIYVVRRPGCPFCRGQASRIYDELGTKLDEKQVSLVGVFHETLGVEEFRPFLKGAELYYDPKKHFYGPEERWLPNWVGFLRVSTYLNYLKIKKGTTGNGAGEGRLLGGMYLLNKDQQIVFTHLEKTWGDQVDMKELAGAVNQLP